MSCLQTAKTLNTGPNTGLTEAADGGLRTSGRTAVDVHGLSDLEEGHDTRVEASIIHQSIGCGKPSTARRVEKVNTDGQFTVEIASHTPRLATNVDAFALSAQRLRSSDSSATGL